MFTQTHRNYVSESPLTKREKKKRKSERKNKGNNKNNIYAHFKESHGFSNSQFYCYWEFTLYIKIKCGYIYTLAITNIL